MHDEAMAPIEFRAERRRSPFAGTDLLLEAGPGGIRTPHEGLIEWDDIDVLGVREFPRAVGIRILNEAAGGHSQPTPMTLAAWAVSRIDHGFEIVINVEAALIEPIEIAQQVADYAQALGHDLMIIDFENQSPIDARQAADDPHATPRDGAWPQLPADNRGASVTELGLDESG